MWLNGSIHITNYLKNVPARVGLDEIARSINAFQTFLDTVEELRSADYFPKRFAVIDCGEGKCE
jgi:hypothetical protein